jgi:hypothetical protein
MQRASISPDRRRSQEICSITYLNEPPNYIRRGENAENTIDFGRV